MKQHWLILGLLLVVSSCQRTGDWNAHAEIAHHFLSAAIRADSMALNDLSSDSVPVRIVLAAAKTVPAFLRAAAFESRLSRGWTLDDVELVEFRVPYESSTEIIRISFVRKGAELVIHHVAFPEGLEAGAR